MILKLSKRPQNLNFGFRAGRPLSLARKQERIQLYNNNPNYCKECNNTLSYDKRKNKFCSLSCSAKHNNKKRDYANAKTTWNNKIKKWQTIVKHPEKYAEGPYTRIYYCQCAYSNEIFISRHKGRRCSNKIIFEDKKAYRKLCQFKFHTAMYPENFDQKLIEQFGFYHSIDNPNGFSRDHMLSINDGWNLKIDPEIINHPANCRIIPHPANLKKRGNSIITLEELLRKIEEWKSN